MNRRSFFKMLAGVIMLPKVLALSSLSVKEAWQMVTLGNTESVLDPFGYQAGLKNWTPIDPANPASDFCKYDPQHVRYYWCEP